MSTKIYEAYEWGGTVEGLLKRLYGMRKRIFELAVRNALSRWASKDAWKFGMLDYADALKKVMLSHQWEVVDPKMGVVDNPESSAVVYFGKGKILVQFFGLPRDFKFSKAGLKDYHWQNQSDPWYAFDPRSKDASWVMAMERDYKERERVWEAILKLDGRPSHSGLTFPFIEISDGIRIASVMVERLHGHSPWPDKPVKCQVCDRRAEENKKASISV